MPYPPILPKGSKGSATSATLTPQAAWAEAFVAAQMLMPTIPKNRKATVQHKTGGGSHSYKYADLPTIIDKVRQVLSDAGLGFAQSVEGHERGVAVTTRIIHTAGHSESFGPTVVPGGGDAQSTGSAITYARRYSLCAALGIAADEDDDGASAKTSRDSSDPGKAGGSNPSSATRAAEPRASEPPATPSALGDGAAQTRETVSPGQESPARTSAPGAGATSGSGVGSKTQSPGGDAGSAPASPAPALGTPSATGTAEAERGDGGGTAKGKDGPAPDPACAHPKDAITTEKPGGGAYRGGFVFCTVCNTVIPSKEVGVGS